MYTLKIIAIQFTDPNVIPWDHDFHGITAARGAPPPPMSPSLRKRVGVPSLKWLEGLESGVKMCKMGGFKE